MLLAYIRRIAVVKEENGSIPRRRRRTDGGCNVGGLGALRRRHR